MPTDTQPTLNLDGMDLAGIIATLSSDGQDQVRRYVEEVRQREAAELHRMRHVLTYLKYPKSTTALLQKLNNSQGSSRYTHAQVEEILLKLKDMEVVTRDAGGQWKKRREL